MSEVVLNRPLDIITFKIVTSIEFKNVSKDFDTNMKTERNQGNVFVKKEVFATLSLQLIR